MDLIRPPISNSSNLLSQSLATIPMAPIPIGITVIIMCQCLFLVLRQSSTIYQILFSLIFTQSMAKSTIWQVLSFLFFFTLLNSGLCMYHLSCSISISCTISSESPFPPKQCLVLYSRYANFPNPFIIRMNFLSLSLDKLYLLFCCVLSIMTFT